MNDHLARCEVNEPRALDMSIHSKCIVSTSSTGGPDFRLNL